MIIIAINEEKLVAKVVWEWKVGVYTKVGEIARRRRRRRSHRRRRRRRRRAGRRVEPNGTNDPPPSRGVVPRSPSLARAVEWPARGAEEPPSPLP
jgi:hypothetical protein